MSSASKMMKQSLVTLALLAFACYLAQQSCEAKLLGSRRSRFYDDGSSFGGYGAGSYGMPTGERAMITVRGARNPYDGSAPSKISIEDNPYRGPYPRGVYDRQDLAYGGMRARQPYYPQSDYDYRGYGG